jgi:hypothetical protein
MLMVWDRSTIFMAIAFPACSGDAPAWYKIYETGKPYP